MKYIISLITSMTIACGIILCPLPGNADAVFAKKSTAQKKGPTTITIKQKDFTYTGQAVKGVPNGQGKIDGKINGVTFHFTGEFKNGAPYNGKGSMAGKMDGANINFSGQIKKGEPFAGTIKFQGVIDGDNMAFEGNMQNGQFYEGTLSGTKEGLSINFKGKFKNNEPYNGHMIMDGKDDSGQPLHMETEFVNGKS
ncbi:hypothetical protein DFP93_10160 [Aneurinibacillus soli]|uniref:Uncharacterized protein n=1 Tax=Aneurinibacillus soli TaxID=1500254 RepID=A0A0U5AW59_9BACL|nr:hypothetical protein [Aneurinibacillus soli]PYE64036.1 hypothetical protein DFP93_10160 [Aneurinibacillus soli]BAU27985.1 hypothetical protein CB4_02159 [Aneurinibacillus soli]